MPGREAGHSGVSALSDDTTRWGRPSTRPNVDSVPWSIVDIIIAIVIGAVLFKVGSTILGSFARPVPAPPDPGELRKVRLTYRCSICYTEVRMTMANDEVPEAPRHCMEDMELVTPVDDL